MEILATLEERIERLIEAHRTMAARVAELEEENASLRSTTSKGGEMGKRVAELEQERGQVRQRIESLVKQLRELDV